MHAWCILYLAETTLGDDDPCLLYRLHYTWSWEHLQILRHRMRQSKKAQK